MKIAIIKERKNPPDRRVVLTPKECKRLLRKHSNLKIVIESSDSHARTRQCGDTELHENWCLSH